MLGAVRDGSTRCSLRTPLECRNSVSCSIHDVATVVSIYFFVIIIIYFIIFVCILIVVVFPVLLCDCIEDVSFAET
jgi:hypothetical protein